MATYYGTDLFLGATGIDPRFSLITGKAVVAYNLFRRFTTAFNLPAYKGNSFDIRDVASDKLSVNSLPAIEKDMIRVAVFEPRVSTIYPKVTLDFAKELLKANVRGVLVEGVAFELIFDINTVTAALVGIPTVL